MMGWIRNAVIRSLDQRVKQSILKWFVYVDMNGGKSGKTCMRFLSLSRCSQGHISLSIICHYTGNMIHLYNSCRNFWWPLQCECWREADVGALQSPWLPGDHNTGYNTLFRKIILMTLMSRTVIINVVVLIPDMSVSASNTLPHNLVWYLSIV